MSSAAPQDNITLSLNELEALIRAQSKKLSMRNLPGCSPAPPRPSRIGHTKTPAILPVTSW